MASFEEEALRRAQQMHSRPPHQTEREKKPKPPEKQPEDTPQKTDNKQENKAQGQQKSLVDFLLADKEQSLILLLLLLLLPPRRECRGKEHEQSYLFRWVMIQCREPFGSICGGLRLSVRQYQAKRRIW